jgi:hypothetical protein
VRTAGDPISRASAQLAKVCSFEPTAVDDPAKISEISDEWNVLLHKNA